MKEKVIRKLESLTDSDLVEVSNFIDFLRFKIKNPELYKSENLLDHFRQYRIFNWKELAAAIRDSGIERGPVGGYMEWSAVVKWISLTYNLEWDAAKEALELLQRQNLLHTSSYGNIG